MLFSDIYIVKAKRTPFGRFGGALREYSAVELGSKVVQQLVAEQPDLIDQIDHFFLGLCLPGSGFSPARQVVLAAKMPAEISATTIDRACCSALSAIGLGALKVNGGANFVVAGGMENMSATPYLIPQMRWGQRLGDVLIKDELVIRNPYLNTPMALYAGEFAVERGVSREEQDEWALLSQHRWFAAAQAGLFFEEIIPLTIIDKKEKVEFSRDENPRRGVTIERLSKIPTVYGSPTVTAGNASGIADGAAAILLAGKNAIDEYYLEPLAEIIFHSSLSGEPRATAILPGLVIKKALVETGLVLDDIKLIEINEAFAAMPTVSSLELVDWDRSRVGQVREITNVNGGAIAIGHPLGATGARLMMTLVYELRRRGGGYGVIAICGAIGQVDVAIVKV